MAAPINTTPFLGVWKGLYLRDRALDADRMYAHEAKNVSLFGNRLAVRGGTRRLLANALAGRVHGLHHVRRRNGLTQVIASAGSAVQLVMNGAAVVDPPTALPMSVPATTPARVGAIQPSFAAYDDLVFLVNGVDENLKWDGTVLTRMGIDALTGFVLTLAPQVAGTLPAGTYKYRATYVRTATQAESEGSDSTVTYVADGTHAPIVRVPASPDPQVTETRLYRTLNGGAVYFYVGSIATNGGDFPPDNVPDTGVGIQMDEFTNYAPPGPLRLLTTWPQAGLLVGVPASEPSAIYFCDAVAGDLRGESWPPDNAIFVNYDDGDEIVAIVPFFESLIVQKRRSTWRIKGRPGDLSLEPISFHPDRTGIGGVAQNAVALVDNNAFLPAVDGVNSLSRFNDTGFESQRISTAIDALFSQFAYGARDRSHAVFSRQWRQVRLWMTPAGATDPTQCLVYQLDGTIDGEPNGWTWWDVPATASVTVQTAAGDVVLIGTADGYVLQMDQGFEDGWTGATPGNGATYMMEYETVPFAPANDIQVESRLRFIDLRVRANSQATLLVTPITDELHETPTIPLVVTPDAAFLLDDDPPSVPGAGVLADVVAGEPTGGTVLGTGRTVGYRLVAEALGRYHSIRFVVADKSADFAIENMMVRWQPMPMKATPISIVQEIP